jgi:hypothetical protein
MYGHDRILLRTRELILRAAGFEVCATETPAKIEEILATRPVDLLIFCHTVDELERSRILAKIPPSQKSLGVLLLFAGSYDPAPADQDAVFSTLDGPFDFLRTVCRLTHEPAPSPSVYKSPNPGKELCHDSQAR